jgi:hypothetical protein
VLLRAATLDAIAAGAVDVQLRRAKRPTVKAGGTLKTRVGVLAIDSVERIDLDDITEDDARRSGEPSADAIRAWMATREGDVYRITFHLVGPDPRVALRADDALSDDDVAAITGRLDRLDKASTHGPWTRETLALIVDRPAVRAPDLAASLGRETAPFKVDVRKLKALGLTESLEVGYRISPRGAAYLRLSRADGTSARDRFGT